MYHLTQYVVVRRDLPTLEDIMVQGDHALCKATFCYTAKLVAEGHAQAKWGETLNPDWGHPSRVWKGAKNEIRLKKLVASLVVAGVPHVTIVEPDDGPMKGQLTAVATFPDEKKAIEPFLNDFQLLKLVICDPFRAAVKLEIEQMIEKGLLIKPT